LGPFDASRPLPLSFSGGSVGWAERAAEGSGYAGQPPCPPSEPPEGGQGGFPFSWGPRKTTLFCWKRRKDTPPPPSIGSEGGGGVSVPRTEPFSGPARPSLNPIQKQKRKPRDVRKTGRQLEMPPPRHGAWPWRAGSRGNAEKGSPSDPRGTGRSPGNDFRIGTDCPGLPQPLGRYQLFY